MARKLSSKKGVARSGKDTSETEKGALHLHYTYLVVPTKLPQSLTCACNTAGYQARGMVKAPIEMPTDTTAPASSSKAMDALHRYAVYLPSGIGIYISSRIVSSFNLLGAGSGFYNTTCSKSGWLVVERILSNTAHPLTMLCIVWLQGYTIVRKALSQLCRLEPRDMKRTQRHKE